MLSEKGEFKRFQTYKVILATPTLQVIYHGISVSIQATGYASQTARIFGACPKPG